MPTAVSHGKHVRELARYALVLLWVMDTAGAQLTNAPTYVGDAVCQGCHQQARDAWSHTVHARVFNLDAEPDSPNIGCEQCHGPGSTHRLNPVDPTAIVRFTHNSATPVEQQNEICIACHRGGERLHWTGSAHDSQDLACSDCHNPMAQFSQGGLLKEVGINEVCFGCHQEQRAQFMRRAHMPLAEGQITCLDCHNPHGSTTDPLLTADSINQTCYQCHAEKRGPFLFEHAPVRDSCSNCHTPHGSNHEKLLVTARPILCQQCHSSIGHMNDLLTAGNLGNASRPDARLIGRSCQNCHSQIHGSNHPSGARFHR